LYFTKSYEIDLIPVSRGNNPDFPKPCQKSLTGLGLIYIFALKYSPVKGFSKLKKML